MDNKSIFIRHAMGDVPGKIQGGWMYSPDIILYGPELAKDPTIFLNQWDHDFGSDISLGYFNNIYFRGLNTANEKGTIRLWFYHTKWGIVNWPQNWKESDVYLGDKPQNYIEVNIDPTSRFITKEPLLWKVLEPNCVGLIAELPDPETGKLSAPPLSPKPSNYFPNTTELGKYILAHPNMAWRNTHFVDSNKPTWSTICPIEGNPDGGEIQIGVKCEKMPLDTFFSFSVQGPDADNTIVFSRTQITKENQTIVVPVTWPAGYSSSLVLTYWQGSTPPIGGTISPIVSVWNGKIQAALEKTNFPIHNLTTATVFNSPAMTSSSIVKVLLVGSAPHKFSFSV